MATPSYSDYTWWKAAMDGHPLPTHPDKIECGRFRFKRQGKFYPAAIWVASDTRELTLKIAFGGEDNNLIAEGGEEIIPYWTSLAANPISDEEYKAGLAGSWVNGSNQPPSDDTPEGLNGLIDSAIENASGIKVIKTEADASAAAGFRNRLLELTKSVVRLHDVEKAPVLQRAAEVDGRWFPLRDRAKDAADRLRKLLSVFETEKAKAAPEPIDASDRPQRRATYGRTASVRDRIVIDSVADWGAIYQRYCNHPDVVVLLSTLLMKDIGAGETIPGVTSHTEKDVR